MKWANFFDALQPLFVCHTLPGLLGGLARWIYLLRAGRYKGRRHWLKMLYDIVGGMLVGTVMGPLLSIPFVVPAQRFSMLEVLRTLPPWFVERCSLSALVGFFWRTTMEIPGEKIATLVRQALGRHGKKPVGKPGTKAIGKPGKKAIGKPGRKAIGRSRKKGAP
jgi:hypothetical protein